MIRDRSQNVLSFYRKLVKKKENTICHENKLTFSPKMTLANGSVMYAYIINSKFQNIKKLQGLEYLKHAYRHKRAFDQNNKNSVELNFTHEKKTCGIEQARLPSKRYQKNGTFPEFQRIPSNPIEITPFEVKP